MPFFAKTARVFSFSFRMPNNLKKKEISRVTAFPCSHSLSLCVPGSVDLTEQVGERPRSVQ